MKLRRQLYFQAGAQTFLKMFGSNPETQNVFTKFQGIDLVQLEASMEITQHGRRVMNIVDVAVTNLEDYQKMWDILIKLGRNHFCNWSSFHALNAWLSLTLLFQHMERCRCISTWWARTSWLPFGMPLKMTGTRLWSTIGSPFSTSSCTSWSSAGTSRGPTSKRKPDPDPTEPLGGRVPRHRRLDEHSVKNSGQQVLPSLSSTLLYLES